MREKTNLYFFDGHRGAINFPPSSAHLAELAEADHCKIRIFLQLVPTVVPNVPVVHARV